MKAGGYKIDEQTREMLNTIRLLKEEREIEVKEEKKEKEFVINKNTRNFGDVRTSQEEALIKVIGEDIKFSEDALVYVYDSKQSDEKEDNLIFTGRITAQNIVFQFKYYDNTGDGCYIWTDKLQLSDKNLEIINKVKSGYSNWKDGILENSGDLLNKLSQAVKNDD